MYRKVDVSLDVLNSYRIIDSGIQVVLNAC
jgi:hypothetical protein